MPDLLGLLPLVPVSPINSLNIPGPLDEQVKDYSTWQYLRVRELKLKVDNKRAYKLIIEHNMDLDCFIQNSVIK